MPAKLPNERRARIIELYQKGNPACDIAKWLRHDRETVLKILHDEGVPIRRGAKKRDLSETQEDEVKKLYEQGWDVTQLMKEYDTGRTTIYTALRRRNAKMRTDRSAKIV